MVVLICFIVSRFGGFRGGFEDWAGPRVSRREGGRRRGELDEGVAAVKAYL